MRCPRALARAATYAVLGCLTLGACSSGPEPGATAGGASPTVSTAPDLRCDRDRASTEAQGLKERVGGLQTDDFVVRFSQSTRLGIVTLVAGDVAAAIEELTSDYGVSLVAAIEDDGDPETITGFQQVRDLVEATCG